MDGKQLKLKLSNGHSQHSEFWGVLLCESGVCVCALMARRLLSFFIAFVVVAAVLDRSLLFFSPLGVV